ncbi:very short patch repair endonuclease [Cellulomonas sp. ICMP 17802]|uniref:very short patch repair endonuclease n=1 Tax=Cellulomonas sp. ICMP 17802 TaxID=3239199 RepID=UPI00351BB129
MRLGTVIAKPSWASSPGRRRNMQANRRRDTHAELAVRRLLHARGRRYRVDARPDPSLRRRADIVFTRQRIAVFIDGCFWHGCPEHGRKSFAHNVDYWPAKIAANVARDADTNARLARAGWTVLRFWEHESVDLVVADIERELGVVTSASPVVRRAKLASVDGPA